MGDKIKSSKDEIKATANAEIQKMVLRKFIYMPSSILGSLYSILQVVYTVDYTAQTILFIILRIFKCVLEIDELKKNEAKLFEDVERAKNEKRSAETTLEEILKSRRNEDRNGEINQLQMRQVFKLMLDRLSTIAYQLPYLILCRERLLSELKTILRINQERKLKDKLGEQIRTLHQRNEELRTELVEREEWKKSDLEHAKKNDDFAKMELEKMRKTLEEVKNENNKLSQSVISEQVSKEKIEKHLKG